MPAHQTPPPTRRGMYDQGVWWKANVEGWVKIADMTRSHRLATSRMLLRRAASLAHSLGFEELGLMQGAPDEVVDEWLRDDDRRMNNPQEWVRGLPLYRALVADLKVGMGAVDPRGAICRCRSDVGHDAGIRGCIYGPGGTLDGKDPLAVKHTQARCEVEPIVAASKPTKVERRRGAIVEEVLTAVLEYRDYWVKGMQENCESRDTFEPWFSPDDIKGMVMDLARQFDAPDFADRIEAER